MKKKILIPVIAGVLVIIGVVLFLVLSSDKDDAYYSIKILETKGTVSIERDKRTMSAEEGLKMRDKDYITVSKDGYARIDCDRSTYARFEHNTEASFATNSEKKLKIKLIKGEMVVEVQEKYGSGEALNIVTPNTVMAIRGTVVAVRCIPTADGGTRTVNYCLEGKAEVSTDSGESVTLNAGEGWLTVSDSEGKVREDYAVGAEEFEFADIDVDTLEGADGNPMKIKLESSDHVPGTPVPSDYWDGSPVELNEQNFPDMIFRLYLMDKIDADKDNVLSPDELALEKMDVRSQGINDLKGIEYFTRLTYLNCSQNNLTSLDVSNNRELTELYCAKNKLETLNISGCEKIKTVLCNENHLEKLDVSGAGNLNVLNCSSNSIYTIDLSKNTELHTLEIFLNPLYSLDVSHNTKLYALYCYSDQLGSLDVSKNTDLEILFCGENLLDSLDVSNNTKLKKLSCHTTNISSLDVSHNPLLTELICSSTYISELDVSMLPDLEEIRAGFTDLTTLDLSKNPKLKALNIMYSKIKEIDLRNNPKLTTLYVDGTCNVIK
ncbi:MAG: FecR domain-containing protein [Lachnospiraceae bacterium]|nr:FecR domain-containing protein [Lachnospiraceae bacterium]